MSGEVARREEVGELVGELARDGVGARERAGLLARLAAALAGGARAAGGRAAASGRYLSDVVLELAPHLPARDLLTLREHHGGLSGDALAEALVVSASRLTAGIGAAGGALIAAETAAPPTLLAAPAQLLAETVAVVAVELKLVAELHTVYGRSPQGSNAERTAALVQSWVAKRGIDSHGRAPGLGTVLSTAARQQLRSRLVRRLGRNLSTLAPFLAGALAGAELNRRDTRTLGEKLMRDLTRR